MDFHGNIGHNHRINIQISMNGLHVDSIQKSYGMRPVLSDVYLSCGKGEIVGLLGRNGSGKSTMLKIIFGSLPSEYSFVRVDGQILNKLSERSRVIKYLPQDSFLPNHIKIKTIIRLFCEPPNAELLCGHPLINSFLSRKTKELSGGERRFFEILLIIHSPARYVLIDEPFNGVSPLYIDEIKSAIKIQASNKGFVITDHSYRNILDVADRIMLIRDGILRQIDPLELRYWGYIP